MGNLCKKTTPSQQKLEAMIWTFGARHCRTVTPDAGDLDQGEYFELNTIQYGGKLEKKYVVFMDDGVVAAPAISADQTLISVSVVDGDSAAVKAGKIAAELLAQSVEARTLVAGDSVEIQNFFVGVITIEDSANAANMTFLIEELGFGGYLGQTDPTELTTTIASVVIMDDAQGETPQDEIITGYTIELPLPLKEMTTQRWIDLIGKVTGSTVTIDGSEIVGFGTKKIFQSLFQYAGRLVGHPVRNDITNIAEDITILSTAPKFDNTNFSGSEIQVGSFNFSAYKDASAPEEINLMARGDHSKF